MFARKINFHRMKFIYLWLNFLFSPSKECKYNPSLFRIHYFNALSVISPKNSSFDWQIFLSNHSMLRLHHSLSLSKNKSNLADVMQLSFSYLSRYRHVYVLLVFISRREKGYVSRLRSSTFALNSVCVEGIFVLIEWRTKERNHPMTEWDILLVRC